MKIKRETKDVNKSYNEYCVSDRWKQYRSPQYHEYRRKWVENPKNMIVDNFPIHMDIEITNYCNLLCTMCPRTVQIKEGTFGKLQHIDLDLFKRLITEGSENGLCSVKFNYLGEPLMHPNVIEMVKFCKDKGIIDVIFNTNAVLLDEKMSNGLLDAGIDGLFISFDSNDKEKYESIRIGAKYDKVVENVKQFSEIRNSNENYWKTQIRVSKVLFPEETDQDISAFIDMWKDKVDAVGFGTLMDDNSEIEYSSSYRCDQPWQRMFVRQDGVAFPCCRDYRKSYVVGDVNRENVKDIWQNDFYKRLRDAHATGRYNQIDICKNCTYICASSVSFEK